MFNTTEELINDIKNGKMVILVDDEDRENEGDLVLAADHCTPQAINFMAMQARGLICLSLSPQQVERLQLPQMVREENNYAPNKTAFTVTIEASTGVTTGISAADRAHTVKVAAHPQAQPQDVHTPGHIFPIKAQHGGVLKRAGHTEGSVDLATLAGLNPAAVICEVMNDDGTMARVPELKEFARKHGLKIGSIVDLIEHRLSRDVLVEEIFATDLPKKLGGFKARVFKSKIDSTEHLVLQKGTISAEKPTLVRVQVDSYTRDLFTHLPQSTGDQFLEKIAGEEGVFLLIRGTNKPTGLVAELKNVTGEGGGGGNDMDHRDYGVGAQILRALGVRKIKLLTKHPAPPVDGENKRVGLKAYDLEIIEEVQLKN